MKKETKEPQAEEQDMATRLQVTCGECSSHKHSLILIERSVGGIRIHLLCNTCGLLSQLTLEGTIQKGEEKLTPIKSPPGYTA